MGKNLVFEFLSSLLFPEYFPIYSKCQRFYHSRSKASWSVLHPVLLVLLIIMLSCITGCIQNYKYSDAYMGAPSAQDKALKEPYSNGSMALKDSASIDPRMRLELDFRPEVSRNLFSLSGDLVLWGNTTLPYIMLNATLWEKGLRVEKARYMLIQVEPGKKYIFDISRNLRVTRGEYDCILEASGPSGSLFSEKRRALTIDEPVENVLDRNPDAEEKSRQDVSESSKSWSSEYLGQSQNGNAEENRIYRENSAAKSSERASQISDSDSRVTAPTKTKSESVSGEDAAGREEQIDYVSKKASTETNGISRPNRSAVDNNKGEAKVEEMFVGSSGSNKYHRPECRFVDKIKNKIYFKSAQEARKSGKVACKTCNPP